MMKRGIWKGLVVGCLATMLFAGSAAVPAEAAEGYVIPDEVIAEQVVPGDAEVNANITRWYYKTVNGKRYRRLYDETDQEWLTDWILCS